MDEIEVRRNVREAYSGIAEKGKSCCVSCGPDNKQFAKSIGYSEAELASIPDEADLGLSCGNPTALASLRGGEVVLDLVLGSTEGSRMTPLFFSRKCVSYLQRGPRWCYVEGV